MERLLDGWKEASRPADPGPQSGPLGVEQRAERDPFDLAQLDYVAGVCRECRTLSEAGRRLFAVSRTKRSVTNDADRLKKYLARFGLSWSDVAG